MSADAPTQRELAYRLFATEYDDADYSYSESDEERAPNYVVTPTGARVNRLFVAGVLTEVEQVSDDVLRARVVDPTGAFVLYAGQYQPDEQAFLERADTPTFVAVTGKARTFTPDDANAVYTSIRPESINEVDATTRDRWTVQAAEQTLDRIHDVAVAISTDFSGDELRRELENRGLDAARADGITRALEHYETTPMYLDSLYSIAVDAARVVAGQRDEIQSTTPAPDARGDVTVTTLQDTIDGFGSIPAETAGVATTAGPATAGGDTGIPTAGTDADATETDADVTETGADVTVTDADVTETDADVTETGADATETGADATVREATSPNTGEAGSPDTEQAGAPDTEQTGSSETPAGSGSQESDSTAVSASSDGAESTAESISESAMGDTEPAADLDQEEYDLPEETREEIEAEYGTDFQSGTEVPEPGEADIDAPDDIPTEEPAATAPADAGADQTVDESEDGSAAGEAEREAPEGEGGETGIGSGGAGALTTGEERPQVTDASEDDTSNSEGARAETETSDEEDTLADEDPQDLVLTVMGDLHDGDGVERTALVDATIERYDLTAQEVDEAIQDALMDGQCYEPDETTLKPI